MPTGLSLNSQELARLEACSAALLSPLDQPSIDHWRARVNESARHLFGVGTALFALPAAPDRAMCFSEELSAEVLAHAAAMHLSDAGRARAIAAGLEVSNQTSVVAGDWVGYNRDPAVNEFLKPNRLLDALGLVADWPTREAGAGEFGSLILYHDRYGTELMGQRGLQILRLLLPSFKSGVQSALRLDEHRAALARVVDSLGLALQVSSPDGRVLHESDALRRILEEDVEPKRIRSEMERVARRLSERLSVPTKARANAASDAAPYRELSSATARYRLHATVLGPGVFGLSAAVLVLLDRVTPRWLSAEALRERFGLTPREVQVARFVAEGLTNAEIARRLGVSLHTVRRHAERILTKLGVRRRAEVSPHLQDR
jgi:DNA-binding CsgD family transcriptional regulator